MDKHWKAVFFTRHAACSSQPVSPSPTPSVEGRDQPESEGRPFYREEQRESRRTLHTASNLLGEGPQSEPYYSAECFNGFAAQVEWQAADVDSNNGTSIRDKEGNYGPDIMQIALNEAGLRDPKGVGYEIVNVGNQHGILHNKIEQGTAQAVVVYWGGHLYCIRRHRSTNMWWNLDSQAAVPKSLTATELVTHLRGEAVGHADIQLYSVPFLDEADERLRRIYSRSGPAAPCIGRHERPHDMGDFAVKEEGAVSISEVLQEGSLSQSSGGQGTRQTSKQGVVGPSGGTAKEGGGLGAGGH